MCRKVINRGSVNPAQYNPEIWEFTITCVLISI